jgi:glutamate-1-semialdehyde aminotransferase
VLEEEVTVVFSSLEAEKAFRKQAKRFLKKLEEYLLEKRVKASKEEDEEVNLSTYYMDKKIRETSSAITVNFYEMMEQERATVSPQE